MSTKNVVSLIKIYRNKAEEDSEAYKTWTEALALLEGKKAKKIIKYKSLDDYWFSCPSCNHLLDRYVYTCEVKYCYACGQELKWE